MSAHQEKQWLQGQFDKAAADKEAADEKRERLAKRRKAVRMSLLSVLFLIIAGMGVAWYGFREQVEDYLGPYLPEKVADADGESTEEGATEEKKVSGLKKTIDKAKTTIDDATKVADKRDAALEELVND